MIKVDFLRLVAGWPKQEAGCFSRPALPAKPDFAGEVRLWPDQPDEAKSGTSRGSGGTGRGRGHPATEANFLL